MHKVIQKVIGVAADAISAPAQYRAYKAEKQADYDVDTLRKARAYDNASNTNADGGPSDAFKARSAAEEVRQRLSNK